MIFQVNLPFAVIEDFGPIFLDQGLNPEIGRDALSLEDFGRAEIEAWAGRFAGRMITLHGPFLDLAPGAIDPAVLAVTRQRLTTAAGLAGLFRAEAFVFHADYDVSRYPTKPERWLEVSAETWRQVLKASKEWGGPVLLENVYENGPEMIGRLLELVNDPRLGFCFDTGHFNTWSQAPLAEWLARLGPWLKRLHLHDNDGSFDQHRPIGQGNFDFKALFGWLKEEGRQPGITLEPHTIEDFQKTITALDELLAWQAAV